MKRTLAAAVMALMMAACERANSADSAEAANPSGALNASAAAQEKTRPQNEGQSPAVAQLAGVQEALKRYEAIRTALAKDQTQGVSDAAKALAGAAQSAAAKAQGSASEQLKTMARAAEGLESKLSGDLSELRKAFGELSRPVVALISAHPELQKGRYVFECPMAQGYKLWVQTSEEIDNPYMGTKMAQCGAKTEWKQS